MPALQVIFIQPRGVIPITVTRVFKNSFKNFENYEKFYGLLNTVTVAQKAENIRLVESYPIANSDFTERIENGIGIVQIFLYQNTLIVEPTT